ncbi:MAG: hypothetical protein A2V83_02990 [Nitrospirae bacterium RBG_16_64_22]|nr:MAG: hypothetical protein A2V83_02990 [Nitrospirae bacterium RBG_16_64_22]
MHLFVIGEDAVEIENDRSWHGGAYNAVRLAGAARNFCGRSAVSFSFAGPGSICYAFPLRGKVGMGAGFDWRNNPIPTLALPLKGMG